MFCLFSVSSMKPPIICSNIDLYLTLYGRYTIIDEADEMLHSDWEDEFTKILSGGGMMA